MRARPIVDGMTDLPWLQVAKALGSGSRQNACDTTQLNARSPGPRLGPGVRCLCTSYSLVDSSAISIMSEATPASANARSSIAAVTNVSTR